MFLIAINFGVTSSVVCQDEVENEFGAPPSIEEAPASLRRSLERVRGAAAAGDFGEATDVARSMIDGNSTGLIWLADQRADSHRFNTAIRSREWVWRAFVRIGQDYGGFLDEFRRKDRELADSRFRQANERGSDRALRLFVERYYLSDEAKDALLLLGDRAFERGDFATARECWLRNRPAFQPDIGSRLVLASIFEYDFERAALELDTLRRSAPDATGTIAGKSGNYVETLSKQLESARSSYSGRASPSAANWLTVGGDNSRLRTMSRRIGEIGSIIWHVPYLHETVRGPDSPTQHRLTGHVPAETGVLPFTAMVDRSPLPFVIDNTVVVATDDTVDDVQAFDRRTGKPVWLVTPDDKAWLRQLPLNRNPSSTISLASDGTLFLRSFSRVSEESDIAPTHLGPLIGAAHFSAINLKNQKKRKFEIALEREGWEGRWFLDSAPLVEGGSVYVALSKREGVRKEIHVASFDRQSGRLKWRRFIAASTETVVTRASLSYQQTLCWHEGLIVSNTNEGVVAAVHGDDGEIKWLCEYPRRIFPPVGVDHNHAHWRRIIAPVAAYRDLFVVAPRDSDRIFAIDFASGQLRWSTLPEQGSDVRHFLGVANDCLIASGDSLYWIDIRSGSVASQFPPPRKGTTDVARISPHGVGRGFVAGDEVVWPTLDAILVVHRSRSGAAFPVFPIIRQRFDLIAHGLLGGHLVPTSDAILLSGPNGLTALRLHSDSIETP